MNRDYPVWLERSIIALYLAHQSPSTIRRALLRLGARRVPTVQTIRRWAEEWRVKRTRSKSQMLRRAREARDDRLRSRQLAAWLRREGGLPTAEIAERLGEPTSRIRHWLSVDCPGVLAGPAMRPEARQIVALKRQHPDLGSTTLARMAGQSPSSAYVRLKRAGLIPDRRNRRGVEAVCEMEVER